MEYCKADSSYDVTMKLDLTQMTSFDFFSAPKHLFQKIENKKGSDKRRLKKCIASNTT